MEKNFIIAGFGGQGVLFAGKTLANAFMLLDKNVTWYPCYGAEMRGGTVNCEIVVSDGEVSSVHKQQIDCLIALNQLSLDKFAPNVKPSGRIIYNSSLASVSSKRQDVEYFSEPISDLALEMGNPKYTNVIALTVLSLFEPNLTLDVYGHALKAVVTPDKLDILKANLDVMLKVKDRLLALNLT